MKPFTAFKKDSFTKIRSVWFERVARVRVPRGGEVYRVADNAIYNEIVDNGATYLLSNGLFIIIQNNKQV